MPSRVIRSGLLDSESLAGLHDRTFRLYIHLLLSADDYGLVEVGYGPIKRSAALLDWSREIVAKMLAELIDAELILPYEVDRKCYAAINRWDGIIQSMPWHPLPPFGMSHVRKVRVYHRDRAEKIVEKIPALAGKITYKSGEVHPTEDSRILTKDSRTIREDRKTKDERRKTGGEEHRAPSALPTPRASRKKPVSSWPPGFGVATPGVREYLAAKLPGANAAVEFEKFESHHLAKGSQFSDWLAAWRTWVQREVTYRGAGAAEPAGPSRRVAL